MFYINIHSSFCGIIILYVLKVIKYFNHVSDSMVASA